PDAVPMEPQAVADRRAKLHDGPRKWRGNGPAIPLQSAAMKAALFAPVRYNGPSPGPAWPASAAAYSTEFGERSMKAALAQFKLADEVAFDWGTLAEHHYSPFSLTPNPMVLAGALTQTIKRAKIALLGATIPILNPIRVAEEFA